MNYAVLLFEGDYPEKPGSICVLVGIYPTKRAAKFISLKIRERHKLSFFPKITETNFPVTTDTVEDYLDRMAESKISFPAKTSL